MPTLPLPKQFDDAFGAPLNHVFRLIDWMSRQAWDEPIELDYSGCVFAHPFYSIAVPLVIQQFQRKGCQSITLNTDFGKAGVNEYMTYIRFPEGIDPLNTANPMRYLEQYAGRSYIPLICFPVGEGPDVTNIRDHFLSAVNGLLTTITGATGVLRQALMYIIDETVNNVLHHSDDERGYLLAQYYPTKGYLDLVIADIGNTVLQTYQKLDKYSHIDTHKLAMEAAMAGKSTKSLDVDRGFGISTSKKMLTKGLHGKYFLYSGHVYNIHTEEQNVVTALPEHVFWQGAYACMRIPKNVPKGFNPADYYEG